MSSSALHLYFSGAEAPSLYQTFFSNRITGESIRGIRGRYAPPEAKTFFLGQASQGLSIFFVRALLGHHTQVDPSLPVLTGGRGSPAAAIANLLEKHTFSLPHELFGNVSPNRPRLGRMIYSTNSRLTRDIPLCVFLRESILPRSDIRIFIDDIEITSDMSALRSLEAGLIKAFIPRRDPHAKIRHISKVETSCGTAEAA